MEVPGQRRLDAEVEVRNEESDAEDDDDDLLLVKERMERWRNDYVQMMVLLLQLAFDAADDWFGLS